MLIGRVSEVFSTAEVKDDTVNPLRLNSGSLWLCERSLQSTRMDGDTKKKVSELGPGWRNNTPRPAWSRRGDEGEGGAAGAQDGE